MTWLGYVFTGVMLTGAIVYQQHTETDPSAPWASVKSDPFTWIVNDTPDSIAVFAQAPKVDAAVRFLGIIAPRDSALAKLPYADTEVLLRIAVFQHDVARVNIYEPGVGRLWVHPADQRSPATPTDARPVKRVLWIGSRESWISTAWYRIAEDAIYWPRRVVLAVDDTVCLMDQHDISDPQPGSSWPCATPWRGAR